MIRMAYPIVSVVIAAYNAERYIRSAVESVLAQTFSDFELHVVDDGSADDTAAIVRAYLSDGRVRLHEQSNQGQCAAKNRGVAASRGEFVAFLDADDVWHMEKLAKQLPLFARQSVGVVYSQERLIDDEGRLLCSNHIKLRRGRLVEELLVHNVVSFSTAIVRRRLLQLHGAFDPELDMGIDYDLWLRLSPHCEFDFVDESLADYRIHDGQMSRKVLERYEAGIHIMRRFLERNPGAANHKSVRRAWAHTYTGRGNSLLWMRGNWCQVVEDYWCAWRHDPTYWGVYRSAVRALLTRRPPATGRSLTSRRATT